jgi:F-type H+-transporting ATPase subunit b
MGALGINVGFLVSQLANLFILLILLRVVLYTPVMNMLDQRALRIKKGLEDAQEAEERAAQAEADYQRRMEGAEREAQVVIEQANAQARKIREETLAKAQAEAAELLAKAHQQIGTERRESLRTVRGQVADLAIAVAAKLIGQSLDDEAHRRLVEEFLTELDESPPSTGR